MSPLTAREIHGNWATLLLPIQPDDSIDFALLADEVDHFIASKVNGIYSNGSAGEFHTQTEDEFDRIQALLAAHCSRAGVPFQIGVSQPSAQIALARLRRAKSLGPAAFQVTLPDWFPPSLPEVLSFLERMAAEAAPIPLIVYNPPHAKRRLTPVEWLAIAERVPGVVGMKVPGGDDAWYAAMQPLFAQGRGGGGWLAAGIYHPVALAVSLCRGRVGAPNRRARAGGIAGTVWVRGATHFLVARRVSGGTTRQFPELTLRATTSSVWDRLGGTDSPRIPPLRTRRLR